MSLPLLVAIVAVGIALTVLAVHLTGGGDKAKIVDDAQALLRFAEDFPAETVERVFLTSDAADAFLILSGARVGIVHSVGQHFLTRIVSAADLTHMAAKDRTLTLDLDDFGWRGGTFAFADAEALQQIAGKLAPEGSIAHERAA